MKGTRMAAATELLLDAKWWPMDSGSFSIMLMSATQQKGTHFLHFPFTFPTFPNSCWEKRAWLKVQVAPAAKWVKWCWKMEFKNGWRSSLLGLIIYLHLQLKRDINWFILPEKSNLDAWSLALRRLWNAAITSIHKGDEIPAILRD